MSPKTAGGVQAGAKRTTSSPSQRTLVEQEEPLDRSFEDVRASTLPSHGAFTQMSLGIIVQ